MLERNDNPPGRQSVWRRLGACFALLLIVEMVVRSQAAVLDRAYVRDYRLPDTVLPPVEEYGRGIQRYRDGVVDQPLVGVAGPSSVWGYLVNPWETLSAAATRHLPKGVVLNLAMPRNRYADDRMVANAFASILDAVFVPYSAFVAGALERNACPSHLPIVEWSGTLPAPFPMPDGCAQPQRHLANAWLESKVSAVWATYESRTTLRHALFPETSDFGRFIFGRVMSASGPVHSGPGPAREFVQHREGVTSGDIHGGMRSEIEALCRVYAARGSQVFFFHLPSVPQNEGARALDEGRLARMHRAIEEVARSVPECRRIDLGLESTLSPREHYFDYVHLNRRGHELAGARLADAIRREVKGRSR